MSKREPYGFAANRPSFLSYDDQVKKLLAYGVHEKHIYNPEHGIDEAIASCEKGDELVVYSARAFGVQNDYKLVVKKLAKIGVDLVIITPDESKKITVNALDSLPYIKGLDDINKSNKNLGKKHGRKRNISPTVAAQIIDFVNKQGNSQTEAAVQYNTDTSTVSRIINNKYFT